mmetsp:Transcript_27623/g.80692  ORF Transcript_27623/g.80692 Transcript_27623/m.80692 type:complete len:210 (+) Transcript_27623:1454-2083(+)
MCSLTVSSTTVPRVPGRRGLHFGFGSFPVTTQILTVTSPSPATTPRSRTSRKPSSTLFSSTFLSSTFSRSPPWAAPNRRRVAALKAPTSSSKCCSAWTRRSRRMRSPSTTASNTAGSFEASPVAASFSPAPLKSSPSFFSSVTLFSMKMVRRCRRRSSSTSARLVEWNPRASESSTRISMPSLTSSSTKALASRMEATRCPPRARDGGT